MGGFETSAEVARSREVLRTLCSRTDIDLEPLTALTRDLFATSMVILSLPGLGRYWSSSAREVMLCVADGATFCRQVVASNEMLVIEDTQASPSFADQASQVRFFAGCPIALEKERPVGSLCVLDTHPRGFGEAQRHQLLGLVRQAEQLLRLHVRLGEASQQQEHHRKLSLLFYNVFDSCREPIYVRNRRGRFLAANRASYALMNEKAENLTGEARLGDYFSAAVVEQLEQGEREVIAHRESRNVLLPPINNRQFEITISPLIDECGDTRGVVSVAHDITEEHRQALLLKVLHQGITDYQALMSGERLWDFLLQALRKLTLSDYALIGEVIEQDDGPALRIHAITELIWGEQSPGLMQGLRSGVVTLSNSDSLLGRVFARGETVMTDDLYRHPRQGGFPPDNPRLHNFLGVPIHDGQTLIGMYAIANGHHGYDEALLRRLEPFTATCALLINLYRQFAEREQVMQALASARDQAERASQAKSEFLSAMSHELRTPLNAILGFAQLLMNSRRASLDERQRRQVAHIEKSGTHLLNLINEVLDLSRIEAGRLQLSLEGIALQGVIKDVVETLTSAARAAQVTIAVDEPAATLQVRADYTRLKQVLLNLLSNAIKYNSHPGRVRIHHHRRGQRLRVIISDTGPGIAEERRDELFQPFNRLDAEHGGIEGTGIGLSLTKKLVEHMAGEIGVDSRPGQGSDFWFELPLAECDEAATAPREMSTTGASRESAGRHWEVLYIEDNPANQRLMEDIFLDCHDMALHVAPSAEIGLSLLQHQPFDLILMDIHLPGMNGHQALARLRQDPRYRDLPVIGLSANAMSRDIQQGRRADFTGFLTKPIDIAELLDAISQALQGRQATS
ncbi:Signal transduction histidine kinase [Modicisalibacter ilicicola DSM 19980]|uniref:histidine kinase n=1 Tax=Modicisalibacter ilicicola DSM 19980 TaxID=1121942 RepID=A0A1M4WE82_9GAMM|nr:ATP-binding protein [Halomonas ilicicola]SHE79591.1 Signal transduction histidine kinase [Halomonas ilicicola DSM 19980]